MKIQSKKAQSAYPTYLRPFATPFKASRHAEVGFPAHKGRLWESHNTSVVLCSSTQSALQLLTVKHQRSALQLPTVKHQTASCTPHSHTPTKCFAAPLSQIDLDKATEKFVPPYPKRIMGRPLRCTISDLFLKGICNMQSNNRMA